MSLSISPPMGQNQSLSDSLQNENDSDQRGCDAEDKTQPQPNEDLTTPPSPSPSLEWKFIDFHKTEKSPVFVVDPIALKKFIGHYVVVVSENGEQFTGCCLAIDPVSLSVILGNRIGEGKIRIVTLPGYHLERIFIKDTPESEPNQVDVVSVNDSDVAELFHAPGLYSERKNAKQKQEKNDKTEKDIIQKPKPEDSLNAIAKDTEESQAISECPNIATLTTEEIAKKRVALEATLKKNHMMFTVKGDVLEIIGGVKINPPYTVETCDTKGNQIIKKRLGEMIRSLDKKNEPESGT